MDRKSILRKQFRIINGLHETFIVYFIPGNYFEKSTSTLNLVMLLI